MVAFSRLPCYNKTMKKHTTPQEAKTFKIKSTKTIFMSVAAILIFIASAAVSIYRITQTSFSDFTDYLKSPFLLLVSLFGLAIVIAVLIKSQYVVDNRYFTTQFGFIKSKFEIKNITSIILNTDTQKLTVYFGEEFIVLSSAQDWNEEFVRALLAANPNINYTFTLTDKSDKEEN